jgi:putative transposase
MARQPRQVAAAYPYHVIQRGHNRQAVFVDDDDRRRYLEWLLDARGRHALEIHAYVLMDNHVHLLATPATADSLSRVMQDVGRRYVRWFNQRHARSGTLWEGRFRSSLVEADRYLLACQRYIEANPVRAGAGRVAGGLAVVQPSAPCGLRADPLVRTHPTSGHSGQHAVRARVGVPTAVRGARYPRSSRLAPRPRAGRQADGERGLPEATRGAPGLRLLPRTGRPPRRHTAEPA